MKSSVLSWGIVALSSIGLASCNSQPKGGPSLPTLAPHTHVEEQVINLYQSVFGEQPKGGLRAASNEMNKKQIGL